MVPICFVIHVNHELVFFVFDLHRHCYRKNNAICVFSHRKPFCDETNWMLHINVCNFFTYKLTEGEELSVITSHFRA